MEIRGNLDIHELIQIRGGNPNNEYILTSSDAEGNSLWRQHWFLTQTYWDEWENSYNESEATQNKAINTLSAKYAKLEKEVDSLDDNYVTSGVVNVETQELIFTDKNGGNFTVTNSAALFTDTDTYVMSGEYNPEMGEVTFLTNIDTSFKVTGFAKDLTDTFTDSASLDGNTLTFIRNNKQTYDVDLSSLNSEELWSEKPTGNNIYRDIGNVGIGTDSPQKKLHIKSSGEIIRLESTSLEGNNYLSYYDSENKRKGYIGYGGSTSPEHLSIVNDEVSGNIQFFVKDGSSHNKIISASIDNVEIKGNVTILNDHTLTINDYTLPAADGNSGQVLKTDGDGNVTWENDEVGNTNDDKYLISGSISGPNRCVTQLNLLMSDDSTVPVDISNVIRDSYVHSMELDNDTNILTLRHADGMGCTVKSNVTVDLSSLKSDDDTNSSIWTETIERIDDPRLDITEYSAFYNKGHVGIGTGSPQNKLHIEGSGFDNSSIRFLNKSGGFTGNADYWLMGSRSFSSGSDGFEIGRKGDSTGGKLYITNNGKVSIGNGYEPTEKLEVNGNTLITNPNSTSDILSVESKYSNLTYGGDDGVGNFANNLILKHKNIGGSSNTASSIQIRNGGTDDADKTSIELTTYFNNGGADINYNGLIMNSGQNTVNIISSDNDTDNALLSIQADDSIRFQKSSTSWPNTKLETMIIDLVNGRVGINEPNPDSRLHVNGQVKITGGVPDSGKVLTSDVDGLASWEYVNFGLDEEFIDTKVAQDHTLKENYFTKVQTMEGGSTDTNNFILPALHSKSKGKEVVVKHVGGGNRVIITPPSGKQIDGEYNSVFLNNGDSLTFYCDGVDWYIKSHYENKFGDLSGWSLGGGGAGSTPDTEIYFLNYNSGSRTYHDIFPNGSSEPYSGEKVLTFGRNAQKLKVQTKARNNGFYDNTGSGWEIYEIIKNSDTPSINLSANSGSDGDVIESILIPTGSGGILRFRSGNRFGQLRLSVTGR